MAQFNCPVQCCEIAANRRPPPTTTATTTARPTIAPSSFDVIDLTTLSTLPAEESVALPVVARSQSNVRVTIVPLGGENATLYRFADGSGVRVQHAGDECSGAVAFLFDDDEPHRVVHVELGHFDNGRDSALLEWSNSASADDAIDIHDGDVVPTYIGQVELRKAVTDVTNSIGPSGFTSYRLSVLDCSRVTVRSIAIEALALQTNQTTLRLTDAVNETDPPESGLSGVATAFLVIGLLIAVVLIGVFAVGAYRYWRTHHGAAAARARDAEMGDSERRIGQEMQSAASLRRSSAEPSVRPPLPEKPKQTNDVQVEQFDAFTDQPLPPVPKEEKKLPTLPPKN